MGKGLVPSNHPHHCGVLGLGGHQSARDALIAENADLIVAVGVRLDEASTLCWDSETILSHRLIHVSRNPEYLLDSPMAKLQVLGSPSTIFKEVLTLIDKKPSHFSIKRLIPKSRQGVIYQEDSAVQDNDGPVKPLQLLRYINDCVPADTHMVMDAGNSFLWGIHYWDIKEQMGLPQNLFSVDMGFCAMGWAIGSAVGHAFADKTRPVVCVTGDGALLMAGQEITVALQHQLNILYIVLNDAALGTVKHGQRLANAESIAYQLPDVNIAGMARELGINSVRINSYGELRALEIDKTFRESGPFLLDVVIDPESVPPLNIRLKALGTLEEENKAIQTITATATPTSSAEYSFNNSWDSAQQRLKSLEKHADETTIALLEKAISLTTPKHCLELGGGGGSITQWLCERLGSDVAVVATDLNTRFLEELNYPSLIVMKQNCAEVLPDGEFDIIHARALLAHIPTRKAVLARLVEKLNPGGYLLLEEPDFFTCDVLSTVDAEAQQQYRTVVKEIVAYQEEQGMSYHFGGELYGEMEKLNLACESASGQMRIVPGGSEEAEFFRLTYSQLKPVIVKRSIIKDEMFDKFLALFRQPSFAFRTHMMVSVLGQKTINPTENP
ncbi:MAG: thiamine pyrophosphate-dependent enzyme [Pseudomonadales bacterium]